MRAAVIEKPHVVEFKEVEAPVIKKDTEVLIRVVVTGICGSEIHAYHGTHPYRIPPVISGHELAGVVEEVGSAVKNIKVGDRVTVEPHYGCGECRNCREGNYNICHQKKVLGTQEWIGSFGEYIVVPEQTIVKLPDNVSFEQGTLIEPIAVGVHAVRKAGVGLGQTVAILGAGPIGLGLQMAVRASGALKIFITDAAEYNLEIARKVGCTRAINPLKEDAKEVILKETNGEGVDITFLGVGVESVLNDALKMTRRGGKVMEVAMFGNPPKIESFFLQNKEISLVGSNMYTKYDLEISAEAISSGMFDASLFISKIMPIEEAKAAMEIVDKKTENVVKVLLKY